MSSHRVASGAAEQDDGAFGGEEGEGNNKTHAFDRIDDTLLTQKTNPGRARKMSLQSRR